MFAASKSNYAFALALRQFTRLWWLPQRLRESLARFLFKPECQTAQPFRIGLNGIVYRGLFAEYLDWRIFFLGSFERETINLCAFLGTHAAGRAFLDVGANKGLYSLLLARSFARTVAIEPLAGNIAKMEAALTENRLPNVEIVPCALGEHDGKAEFFLPPQGNEGIGSLVPGHVQAPSGTMAIPIRRGDGLCAEKGIALGLVKIDTEGYESAVLKGLAASLARDRPFIVLEIGDSSKAGLHAGGGLAKHLPDDYVLFEISDHTRTRAFFLTPLAEDAVLARTITNNLACPRERLPILAPYIRPGRSASPQTAGD